MIFRLANIHDEIVFQSIRLFNEPMRDHQVSTVCVYFRALIVILLCAVVIDHWEVPMPSYQRDKGFHWAKYPIFKIFAVSCYCLSHFSFVVQFFNTIL